MPHYKQRSIELLPRRDDDGTWQCPYRIIEFRTTCWGYYKGCPDGVFSSREAASEVALDEAKRIVDSLEFPVSAQRSPGSIRLRTYGNRIVRLFTGLRRAPRTPRV